MIFVGEGALLRRAVAHAAARGHRVDLVCSADPLDAAAAGPRTPHLAAPDLNTRAADLSAACTDGIVWSVNNRQIFRAPLLSLGLRIVNVHNGLLPQHRGLPSVAVLFALLHGDTEYGATVHEVDAGIDTGPVLAEHRFPVGPEDRFHQVMLRGIRACQTLFEEVLPAVAAGGPAPLAPCLLYTSGRRPRTTASPLWPASRTTGTPRPSPAPPTSAPSPPTHRNWPVPWSAYASPLPRPRVGAGSPRTVSSAR